ncbi:hypothetical protein ACOMHN_032166 [Nucella lapillus]
MTTALTAVLCFLYSTCFVAVLSYCYRNGPGFCYVRSVFIKSGGLEEEKVWQMSSSENLNTEYSASVPVKTTTNFNIIFEAKGSRNHTVYLDEIEYEKKKCVIYPANATPPPVTTSVPTVKSSTTDPQGHMSDSTKSGDAPTTSSQAGRTAPAESSSDIGLIVGVVVAVVLLLLLGLVLCILFRRKHSHRRKTGFGKQKQTEEDLQVRAAHNAVYSVDEAEPDRLNHVDINPVNPVSNTRQHEVSTTVLPSPANYDVVDATDAEPSENNYTEVNKLKKTNNGKLQQNHQLSDESPYEIGDSSENITPIAAPPDDNYNKLNFHARSHRNHHDSPAPSAEQNSDNSHLASKPKPPRSTARDGGPEVYQNSAKVFQASDQRAASALYQNVSLDADLAREDPSAALYTVPRGTASKSGPSTNRGGGDTPSVSKSQDPGNGVYHVLQEETRDISEAAGNAEDYQHLDFDGNKVSEERDGDLPAPVYSHLNEGEGGHYQEIDRDRRREVIDGNYSHI